MAVIQKKLDINLWKTGKEAGNTHVKREKTHIYPKRHSILIFNTFINTYHPLYTSCKRNNSNKGK